MGSSGAQPWFRDPGLDGAQIPSKLEYLLLPQNFQYSSLPASRLSQSIEVFESSESRISSSLGNFKPLGSRNSQIHPSRNEARFSNMAPISLILISGYEILEISLCEENGPSESCPRLGGREKLSSTFKPCQILHINESLLNNHLPALSSPKISHPHFSLLFLLLLADVVDFEVEIDMLKYTLSWYSTGMWSGGRLAGY